MPTYFKSPRFIRDYAALSAERKAALRRAVRRFVADLKVGRFRKGLRVKRVHGQEGVFEMTWAPDGRATFEYGTPLRPGEPHIVWLRCGGHEIFDES